MFCQLSVQGESVMGRLSKKCNWCMEDEVLHHILQHRPPALELTHTKPWLRILNTPLSIIHDVHQPIIFNTISQYILRRSKDSHRHFEPKNVPNINDDLDKWQK